MRILDYILIFLAVVVVTAFCVYAVRMHKLNKLQKKRDDCDLTTRAGRLKCMEYNKQIMKLMNYDYSRK